MCKPIQGERTRKGAAEREREDWERLPKKAREGVYRADAGIHPFRDAFQGMAISNIRSREVLTNSTLIHRR